VNVNLVFIEEHQIHIHALPGGGEREGCADLVVAPGASLV
jgi:hypothetical protein